jgi:hypothetical protein
VETKKNTLELTPKQSEAMEAFASEEYNFILYGGAIRGGKSVWGLSSLLVACEVFPNSRWCVIREDMEKIRTTTIPSFRKIEPSGELKQSPYEYKHHNGSVIIFKSENYAQDKDIDWMKGLEVNGFLFEEINECQKQTFFKAFERAGSWIIPNTTRQPKPTILATCNPTFGWVKELIYDRWKNNTLPKDWLYIPAKITDNPHLPQAYLDNLKNLPKFEYMVFVEGVWDIQLKKGGEFYKSFEIDKHVDHTVYDPSLPLHISWDDNFNPYLPCGIFQIEGYELRMIDEIAGVTPNNTVKSVCNEIIRKYQGHQGGMFVYGDSTANKGDTKLEQGYNFYRLILDNLKEFRPVNRVTASNPSVVMRGNWINTVFEKNDNLKFIIGENCKKMIGDLIELKEAADGTKLKEMATDPQTKSRYQKVGHFSDLFDYIVCAAFSDEFKKYMTGGVKPMVSAGRKVYSKSGY